MSLQYAETRIADALKLAKGNKTKARQYLVTWAGDDTRLLKALTRNHMTGIVAYHVDRVASGRNMASSSTASLDTSPSTKKKNKPKIKTQISAGRKNITNKTSKKPDSFGMEILKAVTNSGSAVFGLEGYAAPNKKDKVSQRHINAINRITTRRIKKENKKNPFD